MWIFIKTNIAELSHSQCGGIDKRTIEKFEKEAQESGKVIYSEFFTCLLIIVMSIRVFDCELLNW